MRKLRQKLTFDQMLFVSSKIHDWSKPVTETVHRSFELIDACDSFMSAYDHVEEMQDEGLSLIQMLMSQGITLDTALDELRKNYERAGKNDPESLADDLEKMRREWHDAEARR